MGTGTKRWTFVLKIQPYSAGQVKTQKRQLEKTQKQISLELGYEMDSEKRA